MNDFQLSPDDPRLTAYALHELEGDERAAVEAALRANPALRAFVDEIRATAEQIESALAAEAAGTIEVEPISRLNGWRSLEDDSIVDVPRIEPARLNGHVNGHLNGHVNGHVNGHINGRVNGHRAKTAASPDAYHGDGRDDEASAETDAYAAGASDRKLIQFPQFYYIVGGLAAACFAVVVAVNRDYYAEREKTRAENFRMALEKRATEVSPTTLPAAQPAILVQAPPANAVEAVGEVSAPKPASEPVRIATSESKGGTTFRSHDLSLLQQTRAVAMSSGAGAGAITLRAIPSTSSESAHARERATGPVATPVAVPISAVAENREIEGRGVRNPAGTLLAVAEPAATETREDATVPGAMTAAGAGPATASTASTIPMTATKAPEGETFRYKPSTTHTDARFAIGSGVDLFPGPHRVFVAPAMGAAPAATDYSKVPTPGSDIVVLSAVTVSADRDRTFAASISGNHRSLISSDFEEENDYLPRPPPGARFGRNTEAYAFVRDNDFLRVAFNRRSTFAADVDTASYSNIRRMLERGELPPRDAVRIEELLNYFPYRYAAPPPPRSLSFMEKLRVEDGAPPLAATLEVANAPWAPAHRLVRIGLKGREVATANRERANLVFLLDVSSSMQDSNKLPLVKESLRLLIGKLRADDRVAIVTYAGNSGVALASTPVARSREIIDAIDALVPNGLADGATGIRHAYEIAQASFAAGGINRVILCTDGDFNLGASSEGELVRLVAEKAGTGVFLTVLGFGMGNYKDATLELLADMGNGNYGYIDSRREAQKLLVEQVSSTLVTIAKDVKLQVEFNPEKVVSYRLIGYENRLLRREDFNTDQVDAGEIGAGHTVTALYEIVPVGAESAIGANGGPLEELRYVRSVTDDAHSLRVSMPAGEPRVPSEELLTVKVRYKKPDGIFGRTLEFPLTDTGGTFAEASADFRFAAAVAQFGMILRKSVHKGSGTIGDVIAWAAAAAVNPADDPGGYRGEFIDLARKTQEILRSE